MLAWGSAAILCLAFLCQGAFLRKKIRALETRRAQADISLAEAAQTLQAHQAHSARQAEETQSLRDALAAKEAALAEAAASLDMQKDLFAKQAEQIHFLQKTLQEKDAVLAKLTAPRPKLYLPDEAEPQPEDLLVYYNENTGIYHADRSCAPYQAVEMSLSQVPTQGRPCKKCAEWVLSLSAIPDGPSEEEDQLSLFDGSDP